MSKALVFIEFSEQISDALDFVEKSCPSQIIALTPHAEYALEKRGLSFSRPEDFYKISELEEMGFKNFSRVEQLCSFIDRFLQNEIEVFRENDLRPAWFHFIWLKRLYDAVTLRLFELEAIFKSLQPFEVIYFEAGKDRFTRFHPWLSGQSVYSQVIQWICKKEGIASQELSFCYESVISTKQYDSIRLKRSKFGRQGWPRIFWRMYEKIYEKIPSFFESNNERTLPRILFQTSGPNLGPVMNTLKDKASIWIFEGRNPFGIDGVPRHFQSSNGRLRPFSVDRTQSKFLDKELKECWVELSEDANFRNSFKFECWDWLDLVSTRFEDFFLRVCRDAYFLYKEANYWFQEIRPQAFVTHSLAYYDVRTVAHAARRHSVPVIVMPHGPFGQAYVPITHYEDPLFSDFFLAYGDGMANYVRRHCGDVTQPLVVGAPMLEGLSQSSSNRIRMCRTLGLEPDKSIAIYVLNSLDGNNRYLSYRQCSDSQSFRIQRRIVDVLRSHPDIQLIVKGHPNRTLPSSPIVNYVREGGLKHCLYLSSIGFSHLLKLADLFVFDYAATSILEAMTTNAPIYLFNDFLRFEPEAIEALKKRIFFENNLEKFCLQLETDLQSGVSFKKHLINPTYLRLYGSPKSDGQCARRIATALLEIAEENADDLSLLCRQ